MARKKTADISDDLEQAPVVPETENQETNEEVKGAQESVEQQEIPEFAKLILSRYPEEPEMYVDRLGGAFATGTPVSLRGNAVLYKNPYFKS